jgi:Domain of unknown function (DUF5127)/Domain of unknown function (DUF4965)/Domain of unknown function (DUF1793)/Domain of unknown function (DUF4964)
MVTRFRMTAEQGRTQPPSPPEPPSRETENLGFGPVDRRTLLKLAGAAGLAAPGLEMLQGLTGNGAVAMAATGGLDSAATNLSSPTVTLGGADVRPPSIPLAVRSPYLSSWLPATSLIGATPQFWNGAPRGFVGLVRIDNDLYAWAGQPTVNGSAVTPMTAVSTEVTATRSIFTAAAGGVELVAEWLSPVEPGNLELQSVPLTLLTVSVSFTHGYSHDVQVYADITGEWVSSTESASIEWQTSSDSTGRYWAVELESPDSVSETDQMADWGTVVWAAPAGTPLSYQSGDSVTVRSQFGSTGSLSDTSTASPSAISGTNGQPVFAYAVDLGSDAGSTSFVLGHVRTPLISYGSSAAQLLPWWTKTWSTWQEMTAAFISDAASARQRAMALDAQIEADATGAGGPGYAAACALALRQCYGGTELAIGPGGDPWLLGKEISSDGDTNTVDIFDQAFLAWLYLDPTLIPLVMAPILDWCSSSAWQDSSAWSGISQAYYCVHDLGVYPVAAGRPPGTASGAGEQMPIEESAGMLIMAAAYANTVGATAAEPFLSKWQTLWTQWANYLMSQVPTPANQLTTDDWVPAQYKTAAGSVNLGIKALVGLAAAGQIATIIGDSANATAWSDAATENVGSWISLSSDASAGNYLNLAQGATGTWSSLYNAFYEMVIDVALVPDQIAAEQASFYASKLTTYGMPLQTGSGNLSKAAWLFYLPAWLNSYPIAEQLMDRNVAYINDTSSLVPYGDRYDTSTGVEVNGIEAHPTLGAVFAVLAVGVTLSSGTQTPAPTTTATPPPPTPAPVAVAITATTKPKPTLTVAIGAGGLKLSGKDVSIHVRGSKAVASHGTLKLVYTHEVTLKHHKRKRESTVIGDANYSLAAGGSRTVKIKLTAAGLKFLKDAKSHRLSVLLDVTVKGGMSTSKRTTIYEPRVR